MANTFWLKLKMLGLVLTVYCSPIFCTAQIIDDFSDRNLTTSPEWLGSLTDFTINDDLQLQLNADGSGGSYLATQHQFLNVCEWNLWIKLKFSPSSNNHCRVYLMSDKQDLSDENINGYFIQLGESGSNDAIELFRQEGDQKTSICRGNDGLISSSFEIRIRVLRDENGLWEIYVDPNGGNFFTLEAGGTDDEITSGNYFGLYCKYTSSNSKKFYMDDVYVGEPHIDETPPEIVQIEPIQANHLQLKFSEAIHPESLQNSNFIVDQGLGNPILVQADESFEIIDLFFDNQFLKNSEHIISFQNITDISGNELENSSTSFQYFVLEHTDLCINEILFDPLEGCEEFVEIYNKSSKTLNLKKLWLGRIKQSFPNPPDTTLVRISDTSIYILPDEYWVITPSAEKVKLCYNCENPERILEIKSMPDFINDEGHLFLRSDSNILIDQATYKEDYHHPSLNFTDGVSLEKIHADASGMDKNSWLSASINVGFGTPTYQNSQFTDPQNTSENISLSHEIFSPDQDGVDDILGISMHFKQAENSVNIYIFNSDGQQIRYLVKNELCGIENTFYWNGLDEDQQSLQAGIYIIYIEIVDKEGSLEKEKKTVVLAKKFN